MVACAMRVVVECSIALLSLMNDVYVCGWHHYLPGGDGGQRGALLCLTLALCVALCWFHVVARCASEVLTMNASG